MSEYKIVDLDRKSKKLSIINHILEKAENTHRSEKGIGAMGDFNNCVTKSEKNITDITRNSFLNYWTIPNPFKKQNEELCDVLIVFQNNIILISDKERDSKEKSFSKEIEDIKKKWRNFGKPLRHSKNQLFEAKEWIINNPEEIYFDNMCRNKIPVKIIINQNTKFHMITTVSNWSDIAIHFLNNDGSLKINTSERFLNCKERYEFTLQNLFKEDIFLHMFDEINLNLIFKELDTIPDFLDYLNERENFFKECKDKNITIQSNSESNLLGQYLLGLQDKNRNRILFFDKDYINDSLYIFEDNIYEKSKQTQQEIKFDEVKNISYLIDAIITNMSAIGSRGLKFIDITQEEEINLREGLEYLVSLDRIHRKEISEAIYQFFLSVQDKESKKNKFISFTDFNFNGTVFYLVAHYIKDKKDFENILNIREYVADYCLQEICINGVSAKQKEIMIKPNEIKKCVIFLFDHPLGIHSGSETLIIINEEVLKEIQTQTIITKKGII